MSFGKSVGYLCAWDMVELLALQLVMDGWLAGLSSLCGSV